MAVSGCWSDILGLTWHRGMVKVVMTCLVFFLLGTGNDGARRAFAEQQDMASSPDMSLDVTVVSYNCPTEKGFLSLVFTFLLEIIQNIFVYLKTKLFNYNIVIEVIF